MNHRNLSPKLVTHVWRVCCASLPMVPSDTLPPVPLACSLNRVEASCQSRMQEMEKEVRNVEQQLKS